MPWTDQQFASLPRSAQCFVQRLMAFEVNDRPSAVECLREPWLVSSRQSGVISLDVQILRNLRQYSQASSLRKASLSMLAWSTLPEDAELLQAQFEELDRTHSGALHLDDFCEALSMFAVDTAEAELLFKGLSLSGGDTVAYSEFLAAAMHGGLGNSDAMLHLAFQRFEPDAGLNITCDNLRHVLGDTFVGDDVENLFDEVESGGTKSVSFDEFAAYMKDTTPKFVRRRPLNKAKFISGGSIASLATTAADSDCADSDIDSD